MRLVTMAVLAGALLLAGCGSGGSDGKAASASGTSGSGATTTSTTAATVANATVKVAKTSAGEEILVGANGMTLYLFEKDTGTTSACTGGCAAAWPALTATAPTAGPGITASKLTTASGQVPNQVVYNGHLLYFFASDTKPGDVNGTKVPAWYPVKPSGEKLDDDAPAGSSSTVKSVSGSGY
jgi:predicted lipoprotein with Yx(FWY)xxD motif